MKEAPCNLTILRKNKGNSNISPRKFDILLVGHFSKDKNVVDGKEKISPGGAIYYGAFPLKMMGINVAVLTKAARKDFSQLDVFKKGGIPVFVRESSCTTEIKNIYSSKNPDNRKHYLLEFADSFSGEDFHHIEANIIHIGALSKEEMPSNLVRRLSEKNTLSLDAQGFVRAREGRRLVMRDWSEKEEVLPNVKYLKADMTEAAILTGIAKIRAAAKALAKLGPSEIIITHKEGVLLFAEGKFYKASFAPKSLRGRTGRGDTCLAAYLGKRLSLPAPKALHFAARLTSLKLEKEGAFMGKMEYVQVP